MTHAPRLTGQIAVITGSSSGIGRAMALALARSGADVLVHARRNLAGGEDTCQAVRAAGVECRLLVADLADQAAQDTLVNQAWAWKQRVDIWINNAGADVLTGDAAGASFEEKLQRLWEVDVVATMRLGRQAGARMKAAGGGTILNVGWDQADWGMEGDSGEMFAATKAAVMAFTRSLAASLAPHVRVNAVAPGWIQTAWGQEAPRDWHDRARNESLLSRWGTVEDVAEVARFLVSPQAAFLNGQVIPVNGGLRRHR